MLTCRSPVSFLPPSLRYFLFSPSPQKLSLFGLAETRKAVAAFKVSSATASEEWDALQTKKPPPRVVGPEGGVWTAPETWQAAAARQAEAEEAAAAATAAAGAGNGASGEAETAASGDDALGKAQGEAAAAADAEETSPVAAALAVAEALERKKQAAFAADAYAFGMVSWEVGVAQISKVALQAALLFLRRFFCRWSSVATQPRYSGQTTISQRVC